MLRATIREYIAKEVSDWDDEVAVRVRFKDFSGQSSDWQPIFGFWRNLILSISLHFDILFFTPSQLRKEWFERGGLSPLCLDHVLVVMRDQGDIVRLQDLVDPTRAGLLSRIYTKVSSLMATPAAVGEDDVVVVTSVLKDRAIRAVKRLADTHWSDCAVVTMPAFKQICCCEGESEQASSSSAVFSYLWAQRKARHLSINKDGLRIQGVKVSLSDSPLSSVSSLDGDVLHLIWTTEMLHQQHSLIDQRSQKSRKAALALLNSGNKNAALRHMRAFKLANESREKCENLLNRVEEVLNVIANAESTKKVSEAIQIGAQAIKENKISVEEVEHSLQELEKSIDLQKQVESALESSASYSYVEDEDIEEEFKKLELEIEGGNHHRPISKAKAESKASERAEALKSVDSLSDSFSNLKVVDGLLSVPAGRHMAAKETKNLELEAA